MRTGGVVRLLLPLWCGALWCLNSCAWLPGKALTPAARLNGEETLGAFSRSEQALNACTAVVVGGSGGNVSLALLDQVPGFWVTKASDIARSGSLYVAVGNGARYPATVVGEDVVSDVALLHAPGSGVAPRVRWASTPSEGAWVASLRDPGVIRVGIVSGATRRIEEPQTMLGIVMKPDDELPGALVDEVIEGGMADQAKFKAQDRILAINGEPVRGYETLQKVVRSLKPGDRVSVEFERDGQTQQKVVTLGDENTNSGERRNLRMSGPVSLRRAGFEEVFQHDCPVAPHSMGGPVVSLNGEVVGMNIARRDRVTTFALTRNALERALSRIRSKVGAS